MIQFEIEDVPQDSEETQLCEDYGFWQTVGYSAVVYGLAFYLTFAFCQLATVIYTPALLSDDIADADFSPGLITNNGTLLGATLIVFSTIGTGLLIWVITRSGRSFRYYFGRLAPSWRAFVLCSLLNALWFLGPRLLTYIVDGSLVPADWATRYTTAHPVWLLWAGMALAGPLVEELLYRGFLFNLNPAVARGCRVQLL